LEKCSVSQPIKIGSCHVPVISNSVSDTAEHCLFKPAAASMEHPFFIDAGTEAMGCQVSA
jgi:hypothetical protein